jgi:hypothetical protein
LVHGKGHQCLFELAQLMFYASLVSALRRVVWAIGTFAIARACDTGTATHHERPQAPRSQFSGITPVVHGVNDLR